MSLQRRSSSRRSRPSQVQTNFQSTSHPETTTTTPTTAISASTVTSGSMLGSPYMSPDPTGQTNSSVQTSPEPRVIDSDQFPLAPLDLPEPVLYKTPSSGTAGALDQRKISATSPVIPAPTSVLAPSGGSLIRRISSKASRMTPRRRPSVAAQNSRDGSVGPGLMRRRSDSNTNVGDYAICNSVLTDSEPEPVHEQDEVELPFNTPSYVTSLPMQLAGPQASSASSSTLVNGAPTIPNRLKEGTSMRKVSKKNKAKEVTLQLQVECYSDKITWDKSRPSKCIHVDDIRDIRKGGDIRQYRLDFGFAESDERRWFTIMYAVGDKSKVKAIHLIAPNDEMFEEWTETLDAISRHRQFAMVALMNFTEDALREYWLREHSGDNDELDFAGIERVCKNLHINASSLLLHGALQFVDGNRTGRLKFEGFLKFIKYLNTRNDVNRIYRQVAREPSKGITMKEFLDFLERDQREEIQTKRAQWQTVFFQYSSMYIVQDDEQVEVGERRMSDIAFASFLTSFENSPIKEAPADCKLDRPMNEYYISSSHNTYLMGRQIYSESTTEGYIASLINGCRCVEVDCWDGPNGQPVVNHGRTFTTAISFQEAITMINKYAFHKSRLPLWISFEVHCSQPQQAVMAQICKTTFGSRLVTEPLSGEATTLPSPSELVGRILIKVKQAKAPEENATETSAAGRKRGSSLSASPQTPVIPELKSISHSVPQTPILSPTVPTRPSTQPRIADTIAECEPRDISSSDNESINGKTPSHHQKSFTPSIIPVLGELGVYCAGVKFKGFDTKEARKYNHVFSFMESSFSRYSNSKEDRKALDRHNMRYLMRVYPNQTRVTSNNFDPLVYWRRGVQMAALNWQTFDLGVQINRAMFEGGTDTSGYVLKPKELREIQVMPDGWQGKRERKRVTFEIEVISARQLMRPTSLPANKPMNPYVEIEIFHSSDKRDKDSISSFSTITDTPLKMQTKPVTDNGFNPTWKGEKNNTFRFQVTTKYPDLIFVRWVVKLAPSGETYAVFTAKLSNMKQGYRTLPLLSPTNGYQYLFSTLFCRIHKNEPESILLDYRDDPPDLNKLRGIGIGRNVFARSTSPKASFEKQPHEN